MCFGGHDTTPPHLPPPPPVEEMLDVIDEVNGVQSIVVTDGATGKKRRLIQKLPRTPNEQALFDQAGELMTRAIQEAQRLYEYNPSQILNYAPFITEINRLNGERQSDLQALAQIPNFSEEMNQFKAMQQTLLDDAYTRQKTSQQESLNRLGYGHDSTATQEYQAALAAEKAKADQRLAVETEHYGRDLRRQDLQDRRDAYSLREAGRQGQLSDLHSRYALQKEHQRDLETQRDRALAHNRELFTLGSAIRGAETAQRAASLAPQLQFADWQARNSFNLQRHQAETHRLLSQYQLDRSAERPSFGDTLLNLGGRAAMSYATGGFSGFDGFRRR